MPVCTLIRPMNVNWGDGRLWQYGVGQYWFESSRAYWGYVKAYWKDGAGAVLGAFLVRVLGG